MGAGVTVRGALELTRPSNSLVAGALTFIGTVIAGEPVSPPAVAAVAATILATGAGMVTNDYYDREIDAINRPERPIPRGDVAPRTALGLAIVLFVGAVALALTLPPVAIGIAMVNLVALVTYTKYFKGMPGVGNAVVAFLGGTPFPFGGAAVGHVRPTLVLFVLAAFATFGREVIKDIEDIPGDREEGLRTLPIVVGRRRSRWVATAAMGVATAASPIPYLRGHFDEPYLVVLVPAIATMAYGVRAAWNDPGRGQRFVKLGMYLAVAAFVVGRVAIWF